MIKPARRQRGRTIVVMTAITAAGSLLLAGCGAGGQESDPSDPDAAFVFGISADPTQMIPWTQTSEQAGQVLSQIYLPLLDTDDDGVPIAGMADLPEASEDGLSYTFTLRDGITFHDGSELDSEDVKYTFEQILDPESNASSRSYLASVASIEAPDALTVVLHLSQPDASLPAGLTSVNTGIVPSDVPVDSLNTEPVGSGPFKWAERVPNESITLERYEDFYAGTPGVATLEFRIIPDDQAMVSALKTGSVHASQFDNPVTAESARSNQVTVETADSLQIRTLQLRAENPLLADVNTRLAIQCALARQEVIDSAALGAGEVIGPITSPEFRSDPQEQPCPEQDLDKAREYLAAAGTPDGFSLHLLSSQGLYSTSLDEAENVQAQLAQVGIDVQIDAVDSNTYVQRWLDGDFESTLAQNSGNVDPNTMYGRYFTSTGTYNHVAGFSSPELDRLFAEGIATTDMAERTEIYHQVSQILVDNAAWVWIFSPKVFMVVNTSVENFPVRVDGDITTLWQATLS